MAGRLYNTKAWYRLRWHQLQSEPLCKYCQATGRLTPATVVDHVRPHKGDSQLFHDPDNLSSLCKTCHDKAKAILESRGTLIGGDTSGTPLDPDHYWNT